MTPRLIFSRYTNVTGVEIIHTGSEVIITPLNRSGEAGKFDIAIPTEDIKQVIAALQNIIAPKYRVNLSWGYYKQDGDDIFTRAQALTYAKQLNGKIEKI